MLERTIAAVRETVRSKPSAKSSALNTPTAAGGERRGSLRPLHQQALRGRTTPVGHVSRVFRDVYEAERLSAGAIPLARKQESLRVLADSAFERLAKDARRHGLHLENTVNDEFVAPCDPERILKVLLHLLANAISASKERGRIVIDACLVENGVVVSVRDEGPGIDPRAWPYLFREGWKDPSRKGEGLGLTVSQAIVHAHGGKIWCESALGRGTTFRFTIPLPPPEQPAPDSAPTLQND